MSDDSIFEMSELMSLVATKNPDWIALHNYFDSLAKNLEHSGWKKRNGMTQHQKILTHIKKAGSISVREAMDDYSIHKLATRISELRSQGHAITHKVQFHPVTGQKYYRYSMAS